MIMAILYYTKMSGWILFVQVHWNKILYVDKSPYSGTQFWFRVNQYLLLLLIIAWLVKMLQILIWMSFVLPNRKGPGGSMS